MLRRIKSNAGAMVGWWDQPQTKWDSAIDPVRGEPIGWRKLIDPEKRENSAEEWDRLATFMAAVIAEATQVQELARERYAELTKPADPAWCGEHGFDVRDCPNRH